MCGIAGSCNFSAKKIDPNLIKRMTSTLAHRGPDDQGIFLSSHIHPKASAQAALGHRRLSIIDLNTGHQPMSNEDGSIWIAYNGEIYNFLILREDLIKKGHQFKTKSDTEVILHLYEDDDIECVEKLRGMFAFAIWDCKKERLFLARDRVGKKPLVYHYDGVNFSFASEMKALLQNPINRDVDHNAINYFLTYGYVPSPQSILKSVKKLPPAHVLTLDKNGIKSYRYWRITYKKRDISFEQSKEQFDQILSEAVKLRLISDVPLGVFLSGGLDSSIVAAIMSKYSTSAVKTFTIGFEEQDYSEVEYARSVASRYNTEHHEFIVKPNAFEVLNKLVWHYNEPFGDSSCIPTYYVSKLTREFVTVALNGDGGDESLAGYERYRGLRVGKYFMHIPRPVIEFMLTLFKVDKGLLYKMAGGLMQIFNIRATPRYVEGLLVGLKNHSNEWRRYISWVSQFQEDQRASLYTGSFKSKISSDAHEYILKLSELSTLKDSSEKAMEIDINSYLPEDLLVKMDIAAMANSLEARSPFLDHHVMEFVASLPMSYKLHFMSPKHILKESLGHLLPKEILKRKKMGFGVPVDKWFKNELKDFTHETLLDKRSIDRGYFNKEYIKSILDEHCAGGLNHGARIWNLLNLEIWHQTFIDQEIPREIS